MTVASFVVSIVAVLVALGALWYARGQKIAAEAAARAAEAAVELQRSAERRASKAEDRDRVVWDLERVGQAVFLLRNRGTQSAYDVKVDLHDLRVSGGAAEQFDEFPADHAEQYFLARGLASTTTSIAVTWHQSTDPQGTTKRQQLPVVF